jgi:hypothetical protein
MIHVLGAADVGLPEPRYGQYPTLIQSLAESSDPGPMLAKVTGEEPGEAVLPPLSAFLLHAPAKVACRLWLVATKQTPPHPMDTDPLARIIVECLNRSPELYGGSFDEVRVVRVCDFGLAGFARALHKELEAVDPETVSKVLVAVGGGPTQGVLGVVLGCLMAGYAPLVCETNRQNQINPAPQTSLTLSGELDPWLVRSSAFQALEKLHPDNPWYRFLAALQRLDWNRARLAGRAIGQTVPATPPTTAQDWAYFQSVYASLMLRKAGVGEACPALFFARPWVELRARELLERLSEKERCPWEKALQTANPRGRGLGPAPFQPLIQSWRSLAATLPEGALKDFVGSTQGLWQKAAKCDHGVRVTSATVQEAVEQVSYDPRSDPIAQVLEGAGHLPWPLLAGPDRLVLQAIGRQGSAAHHQMHQALLAALEAQGVPEAACHLRLVISEDTQPIANSLTSGALASVEPIGPVEERDLSRIHETVLAKLEGDAVLDACSEVFVAVGPGTKQMNLGALMAGLQFAFRRRKTIRVAAIRQLVPRPESVVDLDPVGRFVARLGHDQAIAGATRAALELLDFGLARSVTRLGSPRWDGVDELIGLLEALATQKAQWLPIIDASPENLHRLAANGAQLVPRWKANRKQWLAVLQTGLPSGAPQVQTASSAHLFPARVELLKKIIATDPWRAVYQAVAVAEKEWENEWRTDARQAGRRLWGLRTDSPLGHNPFRVTPQPADRRRGLSKALDALVGEGLVTGSIPPSTIPRTLLVDLLTRIRDYIATLS